MLYLSMADVNTYLYAFVLIYTNDAANFSRSCGVSQLVQINIIFAQRHKTIMRIDDPFGVVGMA